MVLENIADDLERTVEGRLRDIDRYEEEGEVRYGAPAEMEALNDVLFEHFEKTGINEAVDKALEGGREASPLKWDAARRVHNAYLRMIDTPLRARRIARELGEQRKAEERLSMRQIAGQVLGEPSLDTEQVTDWIERRLVGSR